MSDHTMQRFIHVAYYIYYKKKVNIHKQPYKLQFKPGGKVLQILRNQL